MNQVRRLTGSALRSFCGLCRLSWGPQFSPRLPFPTHGVILADRVQGEARNPSPTFLGSAQEELPVLGEQSSFLARRDDDRVFEILRGGATEPGAARAGQNRELFLRGALAPGRLVSGRPADPSSHGSSSTHSGLSVSARLDLDDDFLLRRLCPSRLRGEPFAGYGLPTICSVTGPTKKRGPGQVFPICRLMSRQGFSSAEAGASADSPRPGGTVQTQVSTYCTLLLPAVILREPAC